MKETGTLRYNARTCDCFEKEASLKLSPFTQEIVDIIRGSGFEIMGCPVVSYESLMQATDSTERKLSQEIYKATYFYSIFETDDGLWVGIL